MLRLILILMTCLFMAGCAQKTTFVLLPDPGGKVGKIMISNQRGTRTLDQARQYLVVRSKTDSPDKVSTMDEAEIMAIFGRALGIQPLPPAKFLLYFEPESFQPLPASESEIPKILQAIKDRHSMDISVNGHTDLKGKDDYNYTLSFLRAQHVRSMLEEQGVAPSTISTTSHGSNNPLVPTADNVPEPRNRRVEVIVR